MRNKIALYNHSKLNFLTSAIYSNALNPIDAVNQTYDFLKTKSELKARFFNR